MLLFDQAARSARALLTGVAITSLTLVAGCQVRPLYSEGLIGTTEGKTIGFSDATSRVEQEVRNQLVFLTAGGAGEPDAPTYMVELSVESPSLANLLTQISGTSPVGRLTLTGTYAVKDVASGNVVSKGSESTTALVDYPAQEFAKLRAIRDAENRAAKELAERINTDLAIFLSK